uniref:Uncharacterized protein n=1 Tax=Siphoviridae sp. ctbLB3 TaxID=2825565 RepID=A0A8S5PN72_9CAUD|nr:MAG TPA: hypothetical protein [Siphoviridae sp. ctbLB3]
MCRDFRHTAALFRAVFSQAPSPANSAIFQNNHLIR